MGSEWIETKLGDFAPFNYGKGLPKRKRNPEGGIPVYGSNGITGYHDEALIEKGIIIGRKGSIGEVEYSKKPFWPIDTTFYVEDSPDRDIRFTYYLLKSLPLQEMNSDSAVPGLNRNAAHNLRISVPDLKEQKRIAHILGTLDDKIELNQRMNQILEDIARAVFKSWFVDFDPVRAKMAGEPYPLPDEVMALFPDELVESELGMIPKGWEVKIVGDFINIQTDSINPSEYPENHFNYYSIPAYDQNYLPLDELGKNIQSRKYFVKNNSLLFSKLNPNTPRIWFPINYGNKSICSTEFLVISPKTYVNKYFLYFLFSSKRFINVAKTMVTGTSSSHQRLKQRDFLGIKWIKPNHDIVLKFTDLFKSNLNEIILNNKHNKNYQAIRDIFINRIFT